VFTNVFLRRDWYECKYEKKDTDTTTCFTPGVDLSDGRATNPPLDLIYVRNKLSGSGPIVVLLSAVATSSTTVKVTWNARRNRRYIEGYHVRWRPAGRRDGSSGKGDGFVDVAIEGADVTEFSVGGLRPHTAYEVNVRPWYRSVVGLESKTLIVRTREDGKGSALQYTANFYRETTARLHSVAHACRPVSVCPSVCLSRSCIESKRVHISSIFFSPSCRPTILVF